MSIDLSKYDFVDFGCSAGGSMEFAKKHWGYDNGIGIDIDPRKVEKTRALGFNAEIADLTKPMSFSGKARFSILAHVLEHIPNARMAAQIMRTAAMISSEFILIRQPWFDSDGPLAQKGLKLYWSDWDGHTNHMSSLQLYLPLKRMQDEGLISAFSIWGNTPVKGSGDSVVVPLDSPLDRHHYDPETDMPKADIEFDFPCYREVMAYVSVSGTIDPAVLPGPFTVATRLI
ncbi:hypothetical protein DZK27_01495 [Rhodobacteraceae bacterium 63075]|nr:hypothetical protein DZK27_01495 [Rhodobacteraceae bacterium 63075]